MFTGLVQAVGSLSQLDPDHLQITCDQTGCDRILRDIALGDSIAVDGVCLTVEKILPQGFIAAASPETLRRSTLGARANGSPVNLEPSLRVGSKLGGHFVTGHVDGWGYLKVATATAAAWEITFDVPEAQIARYILTKGSIAVNGISLTVADCTPSGNQFMVAVIPVTYAETNLSQLQPGNAVNLEADLLGKYVERFLGLGAGPSLTQPGATPSTWLELTPDFLAEHGYQ